MEKFEAIISFAKMFHGLRPVTPPDEIVNEFKGDVEKHGFEAMMRALENRVLESVDKLERLSALVVLLNPEHAKSLGKPDDVE